jgi:hypothetical protein
VCIWGEHLQPERRLTNMFDFRGILECRFQVVELATASSSASLLVFAYACVGGALTDPRPFSVRQARCRKCFATSHRFQFSLPINRDGIPEKNSSRAVSHRVLTGGEVALRCARRSIRFQNQRGELRQSSLRSCSRTKSICRFFCASKASSIARSKVLRTYSPPK